MNEKEFTELYQRQKESGLSIKEFCQNNIIAPATFHYWKKKLRDQNQLPDFIPVVVNTTPSFKLDSVSRTSISPSSSPVREGATIEIEFPNKTTLRISKELDLTMLKALITLND